MTESNLTRELTDALLAHGRGDEDAYSRLISLSYPELRRIASRQLGRGRPGQTLNTTGLVHEVYLKLIDQSRVEYADRTHFFALMARAMRQVIVDYARRKSADKRGGGVPDLELDEALVGTEKDIEWLVAVDDALVKMRDLDERLVQVVECRFFCGYTEEETAEVMDTSVRSVQRLWQRARGWLKRELST